MKKKDSGGLFDSMVNAISDAIDDVIEGAEEDKKEDAGGEEEAEELTDEEFAALIDECEAYFKKQRVAIRKALSCTDDEFPEALDIILDVLAESEDFSDAAGVDQAPVRAANRRLIRRAAFERRVEFKTGISETRARRVQTLDQRVRA